MFNYLKCLFLSESSVLTPKFCEIIIRQHGFKKESSELFIRSRSNGYTQIRIYESGVWIKAYGFEYGESDFIKFPVTKKQLKNFIYSNAV